MEEKSSMEREDCFQENIIDLDELSKEITSIDVRSEKILKMPTSSAYRLEKTGEFQGMNTIDQKPKTLVVEGFTPGAIYNALKIDKYGLDVYSVTPQKLQLLSSSTLPQELQIYLGSKINSMLLLTWSIKFINRSLFINTKTVKGKVETRRLLLSPLNGEIKHHEILEINQQGRKKSSYTVPGAKLKKNSRSKILNSAIELNSFHQQTGTSFGYFYKGVFSKEIELTCSPLNQAENNYFYESAQAGGVLQGFEDMIPHLPSPALRYQTRVYHYHRNHPNYHLLLKLNKFMIRATLYHSPTKKVVKQMNFNTLDLLLNDFKAYWTKQREEQGFLHHMLYRMDSGFYCPKSQRIIIKGGFAHKSAIFSFGGLFGGSPPTFASKIMELDDYFYPSRIYGQHQRDAFLLFDMNSERGTVIDSRSLETAWELPPIYYGGSARELKVHNLGHDRLLITTSYYFIILELLPSRSTKIIDVKSLQILTYEKNCKIVTLDDIVIWNDRFPLVFYLGRLEREDQTQDGSEVGSGIKLEKVRDLWVGRYFDSLSASTSEEGQKFDFRRLKNGNYILSTWGSSIDSEGLSRSHFLMLELQRDNLEVIKAKSYPAPRQLTLTDDFFVDLREEQMIFVHQLKQIKSSVRYLRGRRGRVRIRRKQWIRNKPIYGQTKLRILKWAIQLQSHPNEVNDEPPEAEGDQSRKSENFSFADLTLTSKEPRGIHLSNLSQDGLICVARTSSGTRDVKEDYEIVILELDLDLQLKRKAKIYPEEGQEFLNRVIYLGEGVTVLRFMRQILVDRLTHYLAVDLQAEQPEKIFDTEDDVRSSCISSGDPKTGFSFGFSKEGIWNFFKLHSEK